MCQTCKQATPAKPPPNTLMDHVLFGLICVGAAALAIEVIYLVIAIPLGAPRI